jgi:hypothetical protein
MNRHYDCVLTLALPASLEEEVLDHLLAHPEWVDGFSIAHQEGFGSGASLVSAMERVRGRARRSVLTVLMETAHVEPLLQGLRQAFPTPDILWWSMPVTASGRFA